MAEYAFKIGHKPGKKDVFADYLSHSIEEAKCDINIESLEIERFLVGHEGYKEF